MQSSFAVETLLATSLPAASQLARRERCLILWNRLEPRRQKSSQIVVWIAALDHCSHHMRRNRGQQDAVAEMTRRDVVSATCGLAEYRQTIRSSRTKSSPVFQDLRVAQLGKYFQSGLMLALNRLRNCPFVESRFLYGCSDQKATVAARDEIDLRSAYDMLQQSARWHRQAQHLPLHRSRRQS